MKRMMALSVVAGALLLSGTPSAPVSAQAAGARAVRAVCCKCIDGSKPTASINTGSAPWRVSPNTSATTRVPVTGASNTAWTSLAPAAWVGPPGAPQVAGNYTYELTIEVPRCVIGGGVSIEGRFAADNKATVYFDNNQIAVSQGAPNLGFQPAGVTPFTVTGITPGIHTLKVVVYNLNIVTGLAVRGQVTTACPAKTELGAAEPVGPAAGKKEAQLACSCKTPRRA